MMGFELLREAKNRLWVGAPFPVTNNVWGFFMLEVLRNIGIDSSYSPRSQSNPLRSGEPLKPGELYLNRGKGLTPNESEIADGQIVDYWGHAFLPAGERTATKRAEWGKIFVPSQQLFYLDQIAGDLKRHEGEREGLLERLAEEEKETLVNLFRAYEKAYQLSEGKKIYSEELRDNIKGVIDKRLNIFLYYGGIGKLPAFLYGPDNNLKGQVSLDFLRQLDSHLKPGEFDDRRFVELSVRMYSDYSRLLTAA